MGIVMKKHMIWSNINLKLEDWQDYLKECEEERGEEYTEDEKWDAVNELNDSYLGDERMNLDIDVEGKIIAIASMGLWTGRVSGYKVINKLPDILYSECDYSEWYVEGNKVLFTGHHHDGTNYVEYRILRGDKDSDKFLAKLYNNEEITKGVMQYYTRPLAPYIKKVYGWK